MQWRIGTREVIDSLYLDIKRNAHVMPQQLEIRIGEKVSNVLLAAGIEVI